ncbi:MFS transporter [Senegalia massiliensis]|uniref:MFS transporter n=1 Tax=Senegalia massiliensis TaxID=1720316 RepID=UPI00102F6A28|nr:MFS transporter [Senegalia massiliensis]
MRIRNTVSLLIANLTSSIGDILFYPIFINYLVLTKYSSWMIALVTVLEYFPRLIGPIISTKINNYSIKNILLVSSFTRFSCYLIICGFLFFDFKNMAGIIVIVILNFISDLFGTVFYLNQNKIEKDVIPINKIDSLSNLIYLSSTLGMSLAYIISPSINKLLSLELIALLNAIIFLVPLIELLILNDSKITETRNINLRLAFSEFLSNKIIFQSVILTFCLNLLMGNSTFVMTVYSEYFSVTPLESIAKFSSMFLLGTLTGSFLKAIFSKIKVPFGYSIFFSYLVLSIFYFSLKIEPNFVNPAIYFLVGSSIGILQPLLNARIYIYSDESNVSNMFAITSLLNSIGTIFSPFFLNFLFLSIGYNGAITLGMFYYIAGAITIILSGKLKLF